MITSLSFKAGRSLESRPEQLDLTPITVFVGPNNSGKSRILTEIHTRCSQGFPQATDVILDSLTFSSHSYADAERRVDAASLAPLPGETLQANHIFVGARGARNMIERDHLIRILQQPSNDIRMFAQFYLSFNTIYLVGATRMNLIQDQDAGDLQAQPHNSLQVLFRDDTRRREVRRILHEAFNEYLVVDPTNLGMLRLRFSKRPPATDAEERGIDSSAVQFHSEATLIHQYSDGVRSFTGMVIDFIAGSPEIILVDEPEAFLHPTLASKLGLELTRTSRGSGKQLFASTHSANFIMGCVQSGAPVNIVRLTYRGGQATARALRSDALLKLMRNPLLRSTGVLNALFYEHVVVTESDADRAFYQEVNERLLRFDPSRAIPNCLFLNAQNKQTVHHILRPLRELGIPAAGIVDIDVVKEGGAVWTNFLDGGGVTPGTAAALGHTRAIVKREMEATGKDMKRNGGLKILTGSAQTDARHLFDQLFEYGLFVVPSGELESWLSHLGVTGHGPSWLTAMFEKMGEDPTTGGYVRPTTGDVWDFIFSIRKWMVKPQRKGIPE